MLAHVPAVLFGQAVTTIVPLEYVRRQPRFSLRASAYQSSPGRCTQRRLRIAETFARLVSGKGGPP
jgi:hypothetical protein